MSVRWLTYAELGELMGGKTPQAGRQLAARKRWRRQKNNEGKAIVGVPEEDIGALEAKPKRPPGQPPEHPSGQVDGPVPGLLERLEALQAELVAMAQRAGASEAQVTELRAALEETRADRDAWRDQARRLAASLDRPGWLARLLHRRRAL